MLSLPQHSIFYVQSNLSSISNLMNSKDLRYLSILIEVYSSKNAVSMPELMIQFYLWNKLVHKWITSWITVLKIITFPQTLNVYTSYRTKFLWTVNIQHSKELYHCNVYAAHTHTQLMTKMLLKYSINYNLQSEFPLFVLFSGVIIFLHLSQRSTKWWSEWEHFTVCHYAMCNNMIIKNASSQSQTSLKCNRIHYGVSRSCWEGFLL